jgi:hypothetical protein
MIIPPRVVRRRKKGWKMPPGCTYVGRPTVWGNRWHVTKNRSAEEAVRLFQKHMMEPEQAWLREKAKRELRGRPLACWCPLDRPCHADVLLAIANDVDLEMVFRENSMRAKSEGA